MLTRIEIDEPCSKWARPRTCEERSRRSTHRHVHYCAQRRDAPGAEVGLRFFERVHFYTVPCAWIEDTRRQADRSARQQRRRCPSKEAALI
jgi:hypothetical protein